MSFLSINGWDVPIEPSNADIRPEEVARTDARAFTAAMLDTRRGEKLRGEFTTSLLSMADADALKNLLLGRGWHFPFDGDLYSEDTGLSPQTGYTATLGTTTPSPKFGTHRCKVPSATSLYYNTGLGNSYTIMGWIWSGAAWEHWARVSDGSTSSPTVTCYKSGSVVANNYAMTVTSGYAYLNGKVPSTGSNSDAYFDDIVVLPWAVSAGQLAAWSVAANAFSALPKIDVGGDVLRDYGTVEMRGRVGGGKLFMARLSSGWSDNAQRVQFTVEEV